MALYGLLARTFLGPHTTPTALRSRFERFGRSSRASLRRRYPSLVFEDHVTGSLALESVRAPAAPKTVLIHLHGGAFVFGSTASYRNRAMRLSYRLQAEVFVPDYRLAPEHPFPAALDDALAAYRYVRALRPDARILITGDSAGGGLALSLLVLLRRLAEPLPAGAILLSPWTDLSVSGASVAANHGKDRWLARAHLVQWSRYYAGDADRSLPLLSPVFAELAGLPPLLVLAGEDEVLLDDATRVVAAATRAGTHAELLIGKSMQHDWPLTMPWLPESREAWAKMRRFVDR
ncbi:MAG TPA: alpha/beta hydrolase fold domain-containing protein [Polyangiaceae bacterium]